MLVLIGESTDADGKYIYIANLIINRLCSEPITSVHLNFVQLEKCNHRTIGNLFNEYL